MNASKFIKNCVKSVKICEYITAFVPENMKIFVLISFIRYIFQNIIQPAFFGNNKVLSCLKKGAPAFYCSAPETTGRKKDFQDGAVQTDPGTVRRIIFPAASPSEHRQKISVPSGWGD